MAATLERSCTFLVAADRAPTPSEIKDALENGGEDARRDAMRAAVAALVAGGEPVPGLFISVVRYVLPSEDHFTQKLLLLYLVRRGWEGGAKARSRARGRAAPPPAARQSPSHPRQETIEKTDASGKLLPEMVRRSRVERGARAPAPDNLADAPSRPRPPQILICQNLRNNLQHPNEFVRGATLRLLARVKEEELVEPLLPSVVACLDHRHSHVRRNAVVALAALRRLPRGDALLADAVDAVATLLESEQDPSTKRHAFAFLAEHAPERATAALLAAGDGVGAWPEGIQLAALDHARRACAADPAARGGFMASVLALLSAPSPAVRYEAARALASLSSAPTAVRAAGAALASLLATASDNNVRLVVLDRLADLKAAHADVLEDLLLDILRALASPDADVRAKTLALGLDLVTSRSVEAVVAVLKKEIVRSAAASSDGGGNAPPRADLVAAVHAVAVRFPEVAPSVVTLLMDFLADGGAGGGEGPVPAAAAATALDVATFVRDIAASVPALRPLILERLLDGLGAIRAPRAACAALWTLGEFAAAPADVAAAIECVKAAVGPLPIVKEAAAPGAQEGEGEEEGDADAAAAAAAAVSIAAARPRVLADGSYATQSAAAVPTAAPVRRDSDDGAPNLRRFVLAGDALAGPAAAAALAKLVARLAAAPGVAGTPSLHRVAAEAMLVVAALLRAAAPGALPPPAAAGDADAADRLQDCLHALGAVVAGDTAALSPWLNDCRAAGGAVATRATAAAAADGGPPPPPPQAPDDAIHFLPLAGKGGPPGAGAPAGDADVEAAARGGALGGARAPPRAPRVVQLTGLGDPIYAEAEVTVHQYDVGLDVTLTNRTAAPMAAVTLDLATMGDLRLTERPRPLALAPGASATVRANVKVASTEAGAVFGSITYEAPRARGAPAAPPPAIVLADVHVDVMDYIAPATVGDAAFRAMWAEFEWENKVAVATSITDVAAYVAHVAAVTNMRVLTPAAARAGECGFLAANLYARSVFGEDALVNVSVEAAPSGRLAGSVRIRSKTQGIALSLGDKLILKQKGA